MENLEYKNLIENMPVCYAHHRMILNKEGKPLDYEYIEVNKSFEVTIGIKREAIIGKKITEILPGIKIDKFDWIKFYGEVALSGVPKEIDQYSESLESWYKIKAICPRKGEFVTYFMDITEKRLLEISLRSEKELLETMLHSIGDAIISVDCDNRIKTMNPVAESLTGWNLDECRGKALLDVLMLLDIENEDKEVNLKVCIKDAVKDLKEGILKSRHGQRHIVDYRINNLYSLSKDSLQGSIIVFRDITAQKKKNDEILYLSYHDQMTGLYNRRFFEEELERSNNPNDFPLSIISLDVNGLKLTNDAFGHEMGDILICAVSDALRRACRSDDVIARVGGDEFSIILPRTSKEAANHLVSRIYSEIENEELENIVVSASIGYGTKNNLDENIDKALKQAEEAMYKKKLLESKRMREVTLEKIRNKLFREYTFAKSHSENVSKYLRLFGKALGLPDKKLVELDTLGEFHDIGLVVVDSEVVNKEYKLNRKEWRDVKRHPEISYQILKSIDHMAKLADCVLSHHERIDGNGYPNGLRGIEIPMESRMLSIVDAYDAMISKRSYKQELSKEEAIKELRKNMGTQFDEELVVVFLKILEKES